MRHELVPRGANVRAERRREDGECCCSDRMKHFTVVCCIN